MTVPDGRRQLIQLRRDTAADWAAANPVLAHGETGWDVTNHIVKIGDGVTPWAALPSVGGGGGALNPATWVKCSDYASIDLAVAACVAGKTLVIDGTFATAAMLLIPSGVDIIGFNGNIVLSAAGAGVWIKDPDSIYNNFKINGGGVALRPLRFGTANLGKGAKCVGMNIEIRSTGAGGIAWSNLGVVNADWINIRAVNNDNAVVGYLLDEGARSNRHFGCWSSSVNGPNVKVATTGVYFEKVAKIRLTAGTGSFTLTVTPSGAQPGGTTAPIALPCTAATVQAALAPISPDITCTSSSGLPGAGIIFVTFGGVYQFTNPVLTADITGIIGAAGWQLDYTEQNRTSKNDFWGMLCEDATGWRLEDCEQTGVDASTVNAGNSPTFARAYHFERTTGRRDSAGATVTQGPAEVSITGNGQIKGYTTALETNAGGTTQWGGQHIEGATTEFALNHAAASIVRVAPNRSAAGIVNVVTSTAGRTEDNAVANGEGVARWPAFRASGLTGAVAGTRYVGATASEAPGAGTFQVGDFVVDLTGQLWICTVAGTPGTWAAPGSGRELGYAAATSGFSVTAVGSGAKVDVTGLTVTFTPSAAPVMLHCRAQGFTQSIAADGIGWAITDNAGTILGQAVVSLAASGVAPAVNVLGECWARVAPTPGVPVTYKVMAWVVTGGTGIIQAAATNPMFLQAVEI